MASTTTNDDYERARTLVEEHQADPERSWPHPSLGQTALLISLGRPVRPVDLTTLLRYLER